MFHVKHRPLALLTILAAALALLGLGCVKAASSSGWTAPLDTGSYILVSSAKGKLDAVDPATGNVIWRFPTSDEAGDWLFPTDAAPSSLDPDESPPALAGDLAAGDASAQLTSNDGIRAGTGRSVAIGDEIAGVFEVQGNAISLVRPNPTDHVAGEPVVPLEDDLPRRLEGIYAEPIVADDVIYVADYSGIVYALKERAPGQPGRAVWYRELGGNLIGDLALDEATGTLFVPSSNGRLYALNSADGTDAWPAFATDKRIWAGPVVAAGRVYVASGDGMLYALDVANGEAAWPPFEAEGDLMTRPVISGDTLLVGSFDYNLYALDASTGAVRWSYAAENWVWSEPIVVDGTVYFADFDGRVHALDLATGAPTWAEPFNAAVAIRSRLAFVDDVLVAATTDGELWGIDAATGAPKWGPFLTNYSIEGNLSVVGDQVLASPTGCKEVGLAEQARRLNYLIIDPATGAVEPSLAGQDC
jgi:outer membrane protein assembly factor BamB